MNALRTGLVVWLAAGAASAQTPQAEDGPVITRPEWLKRPTADELAAVFPAEARRRGLDGRATMSCRVTVEGTLERCVVLQETPAGSGYGFAALSLAGQFRMRPRTVDGKPVSGAYVRIPIVFKTGGPTQSARSAPSSGIGVVYVTRPVWLEAPTRAQMATVYPPALRAAGATAQVQLDCGVDAAGGLRDCAVIAEDPKGESAGRAALRLTSSFRTEPPRNTDGTPVRRARARFPVVFSPTVLAADAEQIARPNWGRLPEASAVATAFPAKARAAGVKAGGATLDCQVQAGGRLNGCAVAREAPTGLGFGEAAMALAPSFRMSAWTSDGRPVDGSRVRIPIRYEEQP